MKQTISLIAVLVFLCGCASLETNAYRTIGATAVVIDGAMNGWGDYVRAKKASQEDEAKVKAAYLKYQSAMRTAQRGVELYKQGDANKASLDIALDVLDGSKNELITLIQVLRK